MGDARSRSVLDAHDAGAAARFRGRIVEHVGDGMLACFDGPARALRCAGRLAARARALGLAIRAGVHTGECEVRGEHLSGITLHLAARVMALARPSQVLATRTVADLVSGSGLTFKDRGTHSVKGFEGAVHLVAAEL